jgi:NADPH:quinone reductase-like Zn-dependent oxidoreductase
VNPMDTKLLGARHQGSSSDGTGKPCVLGWDAAGVVDKGAAVREFGIMHCSTTCASFSGRKSS